MQPRSAAPPGVQPPPAQTVVVQSSSGPRIYDGYRTGQAGRLGWTQIAIAAASIVLWSAAVVVENQEPRDWQPQWSYSGAGIWAGLFMLLPGFFGVSSAKSKTMCSIVAFMVLSLVVLLLVDLAYIAMTAIALGTENDKAFYMRISGARDDCTTDDGTSAEVHPGMEQVPGLPDYCYTNTALAGLYTVCLLLSLAYIIVAIWSSIVCCCAVCCGKARKSTTSVTMSGHYVVDNHGNRNFVGSPVQQPAPAPEQQPLMPQPGGPAPTYPAQGGAYPPPGGYPQAGAYPPPQAGGYPPQHAPPQAGAYPPQPGVYAPQAGAYRPQPSPAYPTQSYPAPVPAGAAPPGGGAPYHPGAPPPGQHGYPGYQPAPGPAPSAPMLEEARGPPPPSYQAAALPEKPPL